jgi:hypothetical protein
MLIILNKWNDKLSNQWQLIILQVNKDQNQVLFRKSLIKNKINQMDLN